MKVGDKFVFNLALMAENGVAMPEDVSVQEILAIEYYPEYGEIVTYKKWEDGMPKAQVNADWITILVP